MIDAPEVANRASSLSAPRQAAPVNSTCAENSFDPGALPLGVTHRTIEARDGGVTAERHAPCPHEIPVGINVTLVAELERADHVAGVVVTEPPVNLAPVLRRMPICWFTSSSDSIWNSRTSSGRPSSAATRARVTVSS